MPILPLDARTARADPSRIASKNFVHLDHCFSSVLVLALSLLAGCEADTRPLSPQDGPVKKHAREAVRQVMQTQEKYAEDAPELRAVITEQAKRAEDHIHNSGDAPLEPFPLYAWLAPVPGKPDQHHLGIIWIEEGLQVDGLSVLDADGRSLNLSGAVRWDEEDKRWFAGGTALRDYVVRVEWSPGSAVEQGDPVTVRLPEALRNRELSLRLLYGQEESPSVRVLRLPTGAAASRELNGAVRRGSP